MSKKKGKLLGKLQEQLTANDRVIHCVIGSRNEEYGHKRFSQSYLLWLLESCLQKGIFAATEDKIIYFAKTITGFELKEFPYAHISSLQSFKKLNGHKVEVTGFGNKIYLKWIKDKQLPAFLRYAQAKMSGDPTKTPAGDTQQLEELAKLKQSGLITEAEFAAQQARLAQPREGSHDGGSG